MSRSSFSRLALAAALAVSGGAAFAAEPGMPQLNPKWFAPQLFWLAVAFVVFYFLMSRVALPAVASVLNAREAKIGGDLETAQKLRAEAEGAMQAYERSLADSRATARGLTGEATQAGADAAAKRQAEVGAAMAKKIADAEARIADARRQALDNLRSVAVGLAQTAVNKLAGVAPSEAEAAAAVDRALKERAQ